MIDRFIAQPTNSLWVSNACRMTEKSTVLISSSDSLGKSKGQWMGIGNSFRLYTTGKLNDRKILSRSICLNLPVTKSSCRSPCLSRTGMFDESRFDITKRLVNPATRPTAPYATGKLNDRKILGRSICLNFPVTKSSCRLSLSRFKQRGLRREATDLRLYSQCSLSKLSKWLHFR